MLPRSIQIFIALVVLLAAASGVRSLIARSGTVDHPPSVAGTKPSIDIRFEDIIPQDFRNFNFRNFRATRCNVMASINNASPYHINDVNFRLGNWLFRFNVPLNMSANDNLSKWNVGSIDLTDNVDSSCADQALYIFNNIAHVSPWACAVDGLSQEECRSLVRISTRMDPKTIDSIRYDENEMGKWTMAGIEGEIQQEISYITDHIDNRSPTAGDRASTMTNDVVVLNYTTTRYYIGDGPQVGWHVVPYEKCSRLSILNKRGLAEFNASVAKSYGSYRVIPPGHVWYERPIDGAVWYGQVWIADIAPAEFVAKCDAATGFELRMPLFHADGTPLVTK